MYQVTSGIVRLAAAVLLVAMVSGCQTANYAGSGPLTLSPASTAHLQKYLNEQNGAAFAVTEDGRYSMYRYCPQASCVSGDEQYFTVQRCESNAKRTCKIIAVDRRIIWEGPVTDANGNLLNP